MTPPLAPTTSSRFQTVEDSAPNRPQKTQFKLSPAVETSVQGMALQDTFGNSSLGLQSEINPGIFAKGRKWLLHSSFLFGALFLDKPVFGPYNREQQDPYLIYGARLMGGYRFSEGFSLQAFGSAGWLNGNHKGNLEQSGTQVAIGAGICLFGESLCGNLVLNDNSLTVHPDRWAVPSDFSYSSYFPKDAKLAGHASGPGFRLSLNWDQLLGISI